MSPELLFQIVDSIVISVVTCPRHELLHIGECSLELVSRVWMIHDGLILPLRQSTIIKKPVMRGAEHDSYRSFLSGSLGLREVRTIRVPPFPANPTGLHVAFPATSPWSHASCIVVPPLLLFLRLLVFGLTASQRVMSLRDPQGGRLG